MEEQLSNLAIVILNYNSYLLTKRAVDNILSFNSKISIIIVDNFSKDNSKKDLYNNYKSEKTVHLLFNYKNNGYAAGNNVGIDYAKTIDGIDTICIMNPDVIVEYDVLDKCVDTLKKYNDIGLLSVRTIYNGKINEPNDCAWRLSTLYDIFFEMTLLGTIIRKISKHNYVRNLYKKEYFAETNIAKVDVVQGCFFVARLQDLLSVGKLDENTFLYCEEKILTHKFLQYGKHNAILSNYFIKHNHQVKDKSLVKIENRIFHLECYYNSQKYYISKYYKGNFILKNLFKLFLSLDFALRMLCLKIYISYDRFGAGG